MIAILDRIELGEYLKTLDFQNIQQIETDYLQHMLLCGLYINPLSNKIIFKGGTALQKVYNLNRFSIDLDFTSPLMNAEIERIILESSKYLEMNGCKNTYKIEYAKTSISIIFKINGPLYRSTLNDNTIATLKLDISKREDIALKPLMQNIVPPYKDLRPYVVTHMHPNEIFAEKFRAIMTREKARDIYDFDFLISKKYDLLYSLMEKKMRIYENAQINYPNFLKKINLFKNDEWKIEINNIIYKYGNILQIPCLEDVIYRINEYFKTRLIFKVEFNCNNSIKISDGTEINGHFIAFNNNKNLLDRSISLRCIASSNLRFSPEFEYANAYLLLSIKDNKNTSNIKIDIETIANYYKLDKNQIISIKLVIKNNAAIPSLINIDAILET